MVYWYCEKQLHYTFLFSFNPASSVSWSHPPLHYAPDIPDHFIILRVVIGRGHVLVAKRSQLLSSG